MQKMTRAERAETVERLRTYKAQLKTGLFCGVQSQEIKEKIKYFTQVFNKIPSFERYEIKRAWDKYYLSQSTITTNRLILFSLGVCEFADSVRPSAYDPAEWDNADWALAYRHVDKRLGDLQSEQDVIFDNQVNGEQEW